MKLFLRGDNHLPLEMARGAYLPASQAPTEVRPAPLRCFSLFIYEQFYQVLFLIQIISFIIQGEMISPAFFTHMDFDTI